MKYKIIHKTSYNYGENVNICHNQLCLFPQSNISQKCLEFELKIDPIPNEIFTRNDYFGNTIHYFSVQKPHQTLSIISECVVEKPNVLFKNINNHEVLFDSSTEYYNMQFEFEFDSLQYILPSPQVKWNKEVEKFASQFITDGKPLVKCIQDLCDSIFREFQFKPNHTNIYTPVSSFFKDKKGVCQDFSHLAIACLRSKGIAARYVSGYLETLPPPGKPKLVGSDASHAWISVLIPGKGWYEFDPTNNIEPSDKHVVIAYGRDYFDVTPVKGIVFSSKFQSLNVEVDVIPLSNP